MTPMHFAPLRTVYTLHTKRIAGEPSGGVLIAHRHFSRVAGDDIGYCGGERRPWRSLVNGHRFGMVGTGK